MDSGNPLETKQSLSDISRQEEKRGLNLENNKWVKEKKRIILYFITFFLIILGLSVYNFFTTNQYKQEFYKERANIDLTDINNIEAEARERYYNIVKPFYEARILGEKDTAINLIDQERRERIWRFLDDGKEEWLFISDHEDDIFFESFEVIYAGEISYEKGPEKEISLYSITFVNRINTNIGTTQDEVITFFPGEYESISWINSNHKGYEVINYEGRTYLILSSKKKGEKTAILANYLFDSDCSFFGGDYSYCTIFVKQSGVLEKIADISFTSQHALFEWHKEDKNKIIYQESFGEGGGAHDTIQSIDIISKEIQTITRQEWNDFLEDNIRDVIYKTVANNDNCYPTACTRKMANHLCFVACGENFHFHYYLIFNNKIIRKDIYEEETQWRNNYLSFFFLDVKENIYNKDSFIFSDIDGNKYIFDMETEELKQL